MRGRAGTAKSGFIGSLVSSSLGIIVVTSHTAPVGLAVYNLTTLAFIRTAGVSGSGSTAGAVAQMAGPRWPAWTAWSNTTVLVPDSSNSRVIEVDVVTGLLVKIWANDLTDVSGVATTRSRMVITFGTYRSITKLNMYDLTGLLLWSVTSQLAAPSAVQFSADETYVLVGEGGNATVSRHDSRVSKWNSATGAYLSSVGAGHNNAVFVAECWTGTGVGTLVTQWSKNSVELVSDSGVITSSTAVLPSATSLSSAAFAPGLGLLVVSQGDGQLYFLSSVAVATLSHTPCQCHR
jgi:hypothetical protein